MAIVDASRPAEAGLLPKTEVNYRPAEGPESCASCRYFGSPDTCRRVEGVISPKDVCDIYESAEPGGMGLEAMLMSGSPLPGGGY